MAGASTVAQPSTNGTGVGGIEVELKEFIKNGKFESAETKHFLMALLYIGNKIDIQSKHMERLTNIVRDALVGIDNSKPQAAPIPSQPETKKEEIKP